MSHGRLDDSPSFSRWPGTVVNVSLYVLQIQEVQADPRAAGIGKRLTAGVLSPDSSGLLLVVVVYVVYMYVVQCRTHSSFEMVKKREGGAELLGGLGYRSVEGPRAR
jgi:hypothetical protein